MSKLTVSTIHLTPQDLLQPDGLLRFNQAALKHDPTVFLIHNNGYAGVLPLPMAFANPCLIDLAPTFRMRGARIRAEQLTETLARATALCAEGRGPFLIELLEENGHDDVSAH